MSIETTGQEKYDYQDRVVLEQILRFWSKKVSCQNEQSGEEDASLHATIEGTRIKIEVQVKGAEDSAQALTPAKLVEYLAHFPAHSDKNSLLERLLNSNELYVVMICAQRATDECSPLVKLKNWAGERGKPGDGVNNLVARILSDVAIYPGKKSGTQLDNRRISAMHALGKKIQPAELKAALQRLIVLDQWDLEHVMSSIHWKLVRDHSVTNDIVDDVIHRLLQAIKDSKGTGVDVVPHLSEILANSTMPSVRPPDYVPRGIEGEFGMLLAVDRTLLLSGAPRCGKSDTARWVAAQYENQGFRVRICYSVEEADRVINDYSATQSLVVLDDPLGSGLNEADLLPRNYRLLSRLIANIPMNRRLIVAQSQEGLLASANVSSISEVITSGKVWHDLAIYPDNFLSTVWSTNATKYAVSSVTEETVAIGIANGTLLVGPGTLSHLAANTQVFLSPPNLEDIHSFVVQSAQDFAMSLCATSASRRVVRALAIGSSTRERASTREMAFMLGAGGEPTLPEFPGMIHSWGSMDIETPKLPIYDSEPVLTHSDKDEVARLQAHRIVSNHPSLLRFSHPFYRDAARAAVSGSTAIERDEILALLRRGLLCYSPESSAAAARNLRWLYKDLSVSLDLSREIVEVAEQGLSWYFPVTRDLCYEFLLNLAEHRPSHYSSSVGAWVNKILGAGVDDLIYDNGICFLPEGMDQNYDPFDDINLSPVVDLSTLIDALRGGAPLPSGRESIDVLKYFERNPAVLDLPCINRLLSLEEGILRASAAATWLSIERDEDDEVLMRISLDSHPKVAADTIQIVLRKWGRYGDQRRKIILKTLEPWCERPETAAAALKEIVAHFSRGEEFGERESIDIALWSVFAFLFEKAARRFPVLFGLSDSRLFNVCNDALRHLPESAAAEVAMAWADMIARLVDAGKLPSDYELGALVSVISSPVLRGDIRERIVERLLSIPGTAASMVFLADLTTYWNVLSVQEQSLLKSQLKAEKLDLYWLQAAVLTRQCVPAELVELILGSQVDLDSSPETLVGAMPAPLLAACVRLYRGVPGQLWYLGKHHSGAPAWNCMIRYIASRPEHELFGECVGELISFDEKTLLEVVRCLDDTGKELVFNQMIDTKVGVSGEWHDTVIDYLLNAAPDSTSLCRMQNKMLSVATVVLDSVADIYDWTSHRDTVKVLLSKVSNDVDIVRNSIRFKKLASSDLVSATRGLYSLLKYMEDKPPMLHETCSTVQQLVREIRAPQEIWELLENVRQLVLKSYFSEQDYFRKRVENTITLQNWIGP